MPNKERYEFRKSNGLCTDCGKPTDKRLCISCTKAHSNYQKLHPFLYSRRKTPTKYYKEWHIKNQPRQRNKQYKRKYNLSLEQVEELIKIRNNKCDICGKVVEKLHVDHKNINGEIKIRGMLCMSCNVGLGHFKDNIESLLNAIGYLQNAEL